MKGRLFQYSLLTVTLLPIIALLPCSSDVMAVSMVIGLIAGTHVFSTLYLYLTPDVFEGVRNWRWTVISDRRSANCHFQLGDRAWPAISYTESLKL